jgi:PiT family inorganic phosphate transporter
MTISLLGGVFLGWSLGANDAANIFGTAVSSKMLRFHVAALLASLFVLIGAVLAGQPGVETLKGLTSLTANQAMISSLAAAFTLLIMSLLGLPVSTSQAVVGAILGVGFMNQQMNLSGLSKVVACWFGTPFGGALIALLLYRGLASLYNVLPLNLFQSDMVLRIALIMAGSYGAFALGANNVANVAAVFVGAGQITVLEATLIGGASIALGILTFSRPVMETVGKKLVRLDPFSSLVVVLALAITIHIYALIGVPVSSSQAVIGGVLGVGLVKGMNTINRGTLKKISFAWFLTPVISCFFSMAAIFISRLQYQPGL